jgi:alkane 1-monooxygenase
MWKDYKYLIAYTLPLASYLSLYALGIWSFGGIYMAFGLLPLLDALAPQSDENFEPEEERSRLSTRFFDVLLYLNLPILYGLIYYYFRTVAAGGLEVYELVGITLSTGLVVGTIGINVAHELGHRTEKTEQLMAKALLISALYTHFFIEHNRGHHKHVATDEDPASARLNEPIYLFWLRSVTGSYRNAWRLERERLDKQGLPFWSWHNEMVRFTLAQALYLLAVGLIFGWAMIGYAVAIAIVGFLLLESVNYIEHYGLRRQRLPNGHYERVSPQHSWNSDHELGRIFLYELTRHSDHHYKATRKYQVLRHFDHSPQMPMGYPAAILLALLPPLWFRVMNKRARQVSALR